MIRIIGLSKSFGEKKVLENLCLEVNGPVVLMGPSGRGKTTLLRILMGVEQPDSGRIEGLSGRGLAAVFQEDRLCPQLTAAGNICLTGRGTTMQEAEQELAGLGFSRADLTQPVSKLSGGQKRRAALLRALLCRRTDILLMDEPFTGMDDALVGDAAAAVVRLTAGRDALLVTHDHGAARLLGWPIVTL